MCYAYSIELVANHQVVGVRFLQVVDGEGKVGAFRDSYETFAGPGRESSGGFARHYVALQHPAQLSPARQHYIVYGGIFGLVGVMVERRAVLTALGGITATTGEARSALALSRHHVALVIVGTANVAVTRLATVRLVGQTVVIRLNRLDRRNYRKCLACAVQMTHQAAVAVLAGDETFAGAGSRLLVAALIVPRAEKVARASSAAIRIRFLQVPEAVLAPIAAKFRR